MACSEQRHGVQDAVPRSGRFFGLFKRAGHRVVVNARGDLLVRPTPLDASMLQTPAGGSNYLTYYCCGVVISQIHAMLAHSCVCMQGTQHRLHTHLAMLCAGHSLRQHYLATYRRALVAVLRAQGTDKGFKDGAAGVAELLQSSPIVQVGYRTVVPGTTYCRRPHP